MQPPRPTTRLRSRQTHHGTDVVGGLPNWKTEKHMNTVFSALYANIIWPLRDRLRSEDGLEAVEYALVAALLSVVIIAGIQLLGTGNGGDGALGGLFSRIASTLNNAGG